MFKVIEYSKNLDEAYPVVISQARVLTRKSLPLVSNLSNVSALLDLFLDDINWVGFYLYDEEKLYLGPFQGLPACTLISLEEGVCGASGKQRETMLVPDVEAFPGHIACDSASKSEIVVPIYDDEKLYGVLDVDSPILNRFSETDQKYLEQLIKDVILPLFQAEDKK